MVNNIKTDIRYYQPNDPYYWEVDNLPLTDLLGNDIILEERLRSIEESIGGMTNSVSGAFALDAISDLKAYSEPVSGDAGSFGKIFVRPGRFTARMQLPATRESGWRAMRDEDKFWNNTDAEGNGGLSVSNVDLDGVRYTRGLSRTAVVQFYQRTDGLDKFINIEGFSTSDFNNSDAPNERLDLIFIRGSKALDTDGDTTTNPAQWSQESINQASIGVIKGAYFRTDGGDESARMDGPRFIDGVNKVLGRTTGQSRSELPTETNLPNYGTVPMPDDLANYAWHRSDENQTFDDLVNFNLATQASFTLPVAYVRVPLGYVAGDPIPNENIVDIRPFLRTTELEYNERAAIANSLDPSMNNPFITRDALNSNIETLVVDVEETKGKVATLEGQRASDVGRIHQNENDIADLEASVSGDGVSATASSLNIAGRLAQLETELLGGPQVLIPRWTFLPEVYDVWSGAKTAGSLGSAGSQVTWNISDAFPNDDIQNLVGVQFRVYSLGNGDTDSINSLYMGGGVQNTRLISRWGVAQENGDLRRNNGNVNTFVADVDTYQISDGSWVAEVRTYATGSNDVNHYLKIDGYICNRGT